MQNRYRDDLSLLGGWLLWGGLRRKCFRGRVMHHINKRCTANAVKSSPKRRPREITMWLNPCITVQVCCFFLVLAFLDIFHALYNYYFLEKNKNSTRCNKVGKPLLFCIVIQIGRKSGPLLKQRQNGAQPGNRGKRVTANPERKMRFVSSKHGCSSSNIASLPCRSDFRAVAPCTYRGLFFLLSASFFSYLGPSEFTEWKK